MAEWVMGRLHYARIYAQMRADTRVSVVIALIENNDDVCSHRSALHCACERPFTRPIVSQKQAGSKPCSVVYPGFHLGAGV